MCRTARPGPHRAPRAQPLPSGTPDHCRAGERYARGAVGDVGVRSPVAGLAGTGVELAMPVWTLRNLVAFDHVDLLAAFRAMKVAGLLGLLACLRGHPDLLLWSAGARAHTPEG